jgi:ABC-2 type transport system permease protein
MHPIIIIAQREFLQRIRQKSFWILMLLGPLFFALAMIVPIGLAINKEGAGEVLVLDQSELLSNYLYSDPNIQLVETDGSLADNLKLVEKYDGLIQIRKDSLGWKTTFYQHGMLGQKSPETLRLLIKQRISEYEITSKTTLELPKMRFETASLSLNKGEASETAGFIFGLFGAILIIVFINQYANMVLRGLVEEKQNRISELILTSIKPMYFITGKIVGIASVAFLQMFAWFSLAGIVSLVMKSYFKLERFSDTRLEETLRHTTDIKQSMEMNAMLNAISSVDLGFLFFSFLFYFIFGYLLFSALFAIVGVSVGNETDAQQMAMPFTLPLALPVILLQYITENNDNGLVQFLSIFPFTSPTTMLLRIPMGVPAVELIFSMLALIATFILAAYIASKVYRTGVLMYGKKLGWKEMWKWVKTTD